MQGIRVSRKFYTLMVLVIGLTGSIPGSSFAESGMDMPNTSEERQAESRAEKKALIVTDDYIIGPEDILEY
jgi:hypothetical protein